MTSPSIRSATTSPDKEKHSGPKIGVSEWAPYAMNQLPTSSGEVDVIVIASEDSDLGPVVKHAKTAGVRVETVVWDDLRGAARGAVRRARELAPEITMGESVDSPDKY